MGAEERNEDRKPVLAIRQVTQAKVIWSWEDSNGTLPKIQGKQTLNYLRARIMGFEAQYFSQQL
jgi:hypothetical protein